jgi:hypothetical protein
MTVTNTQTLIPTGTNTSLPPSATFTGTNTITFTPTSLLPTATFTGTTFPSMTYTQTRTPTLTITTTTTNTTIPSFTRTVTGTLTGSEQPVIRNVTINPNPYNPDRGNLKIDFEITQSCSLVKVKIYTTGYRLIKQITSVNYDAGSKEIEIENKYLKNLANGIYYLQIEAVTLTEIKIRSKVEKLIILR